MRCERRSGERMGKKKSGFDQYYDETVEPGKRERAYAWATAIGLQDVDGLKPSKHLIATARRHIEGEITQEEARRIVDEYYETKDGHDLPRDTKEADKVAARIVAVINSPTFVFSPPYLIGLHERIFDGIFPHAGKIREVELTKREEVLNGESVEYAPSFMVMKTLEYDFDKEAKFAYRGVSESGFVAHFADFISKIWQAHPFREGNTRTTAVFAIKYLRTKGFDVTNDLFARESWYFRNALVRANYENTQLNVSKTTAYLEDFFKVLLFGEEIELKNRFLRIGFEYGSKGAEAVASLHRRRMAELEKTDIQDGKLDISGKKLDIDGLSRPTLANIKKLFNAYSDRPFFRRKDVLAVLDMSPTAASDLLDKMLSRLIIERVKGHGKGACRFAVDFGAEHI